jgi:hypothetical protein
MGLRSYGGSVTASITVYVTDWPTGGLSVIAGLPDISFLGILMMAAGAVLMFVMRK